MIAVLHPVLDHYGFLPGKTEESVPVKDLRAALIQRLGLFDDAPVVAACQERFAAFLKDPAALPPDIRGDVCVVIDHHADAATYDALLAHSRQASSDEQKGLFRGADGLCHRPCAGAKDHGVDGGRRRNSG